MAGALDTLNTFEEALKILLTRVQPIRRTLDVQIQRHRPARILTIPAEVLSEIFEYACCNDSEHYGRPRAIMQARILSAVSQKFRHVALGTPHIWSRLDWRLAPPCLSACLERSKSTPLTVRLMDVLGRNPQHQEANLPFLLANTHRWYKLDVSTWGQSPNISDSTLQGRRDLDALHYLSLYGRGSFNWFLSRCSAPALQEVSLINVPLLCIPQLVTTALTKCTIDCHYGCTGWKRHDSIWLGTALAALADAPALETLLLHLNITMKPSANNPDFSRWSESSRRTFHHLTHFDLKVLDQRDEGDSNADISCTEQLLMLFIKLPKVEVLKVFLT